MDSGLDGFGIYVVCTLYADWNDRGWNLNVYSVSNPNPWNAGNVVVTRYSHNFPSLVRRVFCK